METERFETFLNAFLHDDVNRAIEFIIGYKMKRLLYT